jgi:glutamate:GABA antiporter
MALTETTAAAATESAKLQRHFGRFDILFFLVCTIVGVDTIASIAGAGGEAFTWTIIYAVIFFIPQALLFAELGTAFPQEGGPYLWTRLAFGRLAGAVNNFLYWVTNPVWIGGSLAASCHDGAGPRFLGVISAKFSTPVRVNVFSGLVATVVVELEQLTAETVD